MREVNRYGEFNLSDRSPIIIEARLTISTRKHSAAVTYRESCEVIQIRDKARIATYTKGVVDHFHISALNANSDARKRQYKKRISFLPFSNAAGPKGWKFPTAERNSTCSHDQLIGEQKFGNIKRVEARLREKRLDRQGGAGYYFAKLAG